MAGGWEVFQFETASEVAPGRWRLSGLLRGQLGTDNLAMRDVPAGTPFVLLDRQVIAAGLERSEVGLALHWRCTPAGYDGSSLYAANVETVGGLRALKPLSPVHLKSMAQAGGDIRFEWIRRGRLDADSWLAADIPLGETEERYAVELQDAAGAVLRSAETDRPFWVYPLADRQADLGTGGGTVTLVVAQVSMETGPGVTARRTFALAG